MAEELVSGGTGPPSGGLDIGEYPETFPDVSTKLTLPVRSEEWLNALQKTFFHQAWAFIDINELYPVLMLEVAVEALSMPSRVLVSHGQITRYRLSNFGSISRHFQLLSLLTRRLLLYTENVTGKPTFLHVHCHIRVRYPVNDDSRDGPNQPKDESQKFEEQCFYCNDADVAYAIKAIEAYEAISAIGPEPSDSANPEDSARLEAINSATPQSSVSTPPEPSEPPLPEVTNSTIPQSKVSATPGPTKVVYSEVRNAFSTSTTHMGIPVQGNIDSDTLVKETMATKFYRVISEPPYFRVTFLPGLIPLERIRFSLISEKIAQWVSSNSILLLFYG
ncbi:uncharacterized protein LDX57_011206 [Aspergillus melleus]|uniref:uncharacterized protein n=1 Tax=Aspergillus melleus TaxID=138277 RepID=UPI001E8EDC4E|nr:uncharacterized protein LDX57_011206 [Aspergillus melleus]KAH8433572.1 hypothetical protein LDX57_011206 [Aspergillus melleus]